MGTTRIHISHCVLLSIRGKPVDEVTEDPVYYASVILGIHKNALHKVYLLTWVQESQSPWYEDTPSADTSGTRLTQTRVQGQQSANECRNGIKWEGKRELAWHTTSYSPVSGSGWGQVSLKGH